MTVEGMVPDMDRHTVLSTSGRIEGGTSLP